MSGRSAGRSRQRVAVVGGGVVGLAVARELARDGNEVTVFDDRPGAGASSAAAGMLAPVSEAAYEETELLALGLAAAAGWPEFAATLRDESGIDPQLHRAGSLLVGFDADDSRAQHRFAELLDRHAVQWSVLDPVEIRRLEPGLNPALLSGMYVPGDHSVDPRAVTAALLAVLDRLGVVVVRRRVSVGIADGTVTGVRTIRDADEPDRSSDTEHPAEVVVVAAGAGSGCALGLPDWVRPPTRPVKGQALRLRGRPGLLGRTVRASVRGDRVYLVPRENGDVVVGATSEEGLSDRAVTARAVHDLLRAALTVLPDLGECELAETIARSRPGTPDNGPIIGRTPIGGLLHATGHYRGGVLLAPITATAIAALVRDEDVDPLLRPFAPERFAAGLAEKGTR